MTRDDLVEVAARDSRQAPRRARLIRREQHMRNPVPPRLLQIALDGAEARSVEAGTGSLGYRDCAVIVNGLRPVLADLREQVETAPVPGEDSNGIYSDGWMDALDMVIALIDGGRPE